MTEPVHIFNRRPGVRKNAGLTLNEIIIVLVIIAITAAVAIPSMIGAIRHGQQVNRMNVARTLYVAMQGQLTRAITEGNLREVLTDGFYYRDAEGERVRLEPPPPDAVYYQLIADDPDNHLFGLVHARLGGTPPDGDFPAEDGENANYVFFISKPAGFTPDGTNPIVDKFYNLLSEVIMDTEILEAAILMEFNIRTGVVMSIFFGDHYSLWVMPWAGDNDRHFGYDYDDYDHPNNIFGGRGMDTDAGGYTHATRRRQGYFGVTYTGDLADLPIDDVVRIFDGMNYFDNPADDEDPGLNIGSVLVYDRRINILFAEFFIRNEITDAHTLEIYNANDTTGAALIDITNPASMLPAGYDYFEAALMRSGTSNLVFYRAAQETAMPIVQFGVDISGAVNFNRYIWVIDYLEGDLFNNSQHSILERYGSYIYEPMNLRARIVDGSGATVESLMQANSHFATELPNELFEIRSVRHLYNIRDHMTGNFVQTANIDMNSLAPVAAGSGLPNFVPIGFNAVGVDAQFRGTYSAVRGTNSQWRIENLRIDTALPGNIGLFSEVGGPAPAYAGTVVGVSLFGSEIINAPNNINVNAPNADNVGAIAGVLNHGTISRSNSFSNVTGGNGNTGGLVGHMTETGSTLTYSFNAGFFNTHPYDDDGNLMIGANDPDSTRTNYGIGSVRASGGRIGGLVGSNAGTVRMSFNNARVNIENVELMEDLWLRSINPQNTPIVSAATTYLGGLVGANQGNIINSYATNFVAIYPNASSGGIAGHDTGGIANSHFILNGISGDEAVTREELMETNLSSTGPGSVSFIPNTGRVDRYIDEYNYFPKNIFDRYPFPLLQNNNPFQDIEDDYAAGLLEQMWGWEDIDVSGMLFLVYFERYQIGNTYVYGLAPHVGIPGGRALRNDLPIREAGYMLIAVTEGISLAANVQFYVRPGIISADNNPGDSPWQDAHRYEHHITGNLRDQFALGSLALAGNDDYDVFYYKLDLTILDGLMGNTPAARNIPLRFATANDYIPIDPNDIDENLEIEEGFFHHLFARSVHITSDIGIFSEYISGVDGRLNLPVFEVRTPWQLQNLDSVDTGTEATWIPPAPGGDFAIPPDISTTYEDTGVIANQHLWAMDYFLGIRVARDIPNVPAGRIETIRTNSQVGTRLTVTPALGTVITADGSRNVTVSGGSYSGSLSQVGCIFITGGSGTVTLEGDFTGINIHNNTWVTFTLGSTGNPFSTGTPPGAQTHIFSINTLYIHLANNTVIRNALIASDQSISFYSHEEPSTGVILDGLFYANGDILGRINASGWNMSTLPQFFSFRWTGINLTMTGSQMMSGVFFSRGDLRLNLPGVVEFNGLLYGDNNFAITPEPITLTVRIVPELPPEPSVLDEAIWAYLYALGWRFPDGAGTPGTPGPGDTPGRWEMGEPRLAFRQTRNISFRTPTDGNPMGDRRIPELIGRDGTTPRIMTNAVLGNAFNGIFSGRNFEGRTYENRRFIGVGHAIEHVSIDNRTGSTEQVSGVFALNHGVIHYLIIRDSNIFGSATTGTIAGINRGIIQRSGVEHFIDNMAVSGASGLSVGGIVGINDYVLRDVYFISTNNICSPHCPGTSCSPGTADCTCTPSCTCSHVISSNGGGIAGRNNGVLTRALYLAPAPRSMEIENGSTIATIHPIAREHAENNEPTASFYLMGHRHAPYQGARWVHNSRYNLRSSADPIVRQEGGGRGLITSFIDLQWLNFIHNAGFTLWNQPPTGYPYPVLAGMPTPIWWPIADSPERPDQVSRDDWADVHPTDDRARAPNFVNGDFSGGPEGGFTIGPGGQVNELPGGARRIYIDMAHVPGWFTRPVTAAGFVPTWAGNQGNPSPSWRLIELMDPRNHGTGTTEFLREYAHSNHQGNWHNPNQILTSQFRYAELNAEIQGTLYQVLPTTPGQIFYYSFFHMARTAPAATRSDRMDFYLTGLPDGMVTEVVNAAQLAERDSVMTLIRPATSPRTSRTTTQGVVPGAPTFAPGTTTAWNSPEWNSAAWNTVAYGASNQALPTGTGSIGGPFDLSYHRGRSYLQLDGRMVVQNIPFNHVGPGSTPIFLYDVWIADTSLTGTTRNGVGITFWSTVNVGVATGNTGSNTAIPLGGVTRENFNRLVLADGSPNTSTVAAAGGVPISAFPAGANVQLRADAHNNVIGFWGVEFGWKHFYGIYEVPAGQERTEFAFQSRRVDAQNGNFLSGVSFRAPAFLSIDNFIRDEYGNDVTFVKPGDRLSVETYIVNWGEMSANNIVISNRLSPFHEYIEFVPNSVSVTRGGVVVPGVTSNFTNNEVNINLPAGFELQTDETLRAVFQIDVRREVLADGQTPTFLYYFMNQAVVRYQEIFGQFGTVYLQNASEPIQIAIDPVRLSKTVDPRTDGPFEVTLRVENVLEAGGRVQTSGLIDDLIPNGFRIDSSVYRRVNDVGSFIPIDFDIINEPGGYTRLIITNVSLGDHEGAIDIRTLDFRYTLVYEGDGFGVSRIHAASVYRYVYDDDLIDEQLNVMRSFPQTAVGITIHTVDDVFEIVQGTDDTHVLDITANDNFALRHADENFDVTPEVVLTRTVVDDENVFAVVNTDLNYEIVTDYFRAELIRGTNDVEFTLLNPIVTGTIEFYYQILLTARRPGDLTVFELDSRETLVSVTVTDIYGVPIMLEICLCFDFDCDEYCICESCPYAPSADYGYADDAAACGCADGDVCDYECGECGCSDGNGGVDCGCEAGADCDRECADCECYDGDINGNNGNGNDSCDCDDCDDCDADCDCGNENNGYGINGNNGNGNNGCNCDVCDDCDFADCDCGYGSVDVASEIIIATGFAFGGGYGISRMRKFKLFMRRADARSAHKINAYNSRRRGR